MKNKYRLICKYCDKHSEINYLPQTKQYCSDCKDSNIKVIDLRTDSVDYYAGCPPFPEDLLIDWPS